MPPAAPDGRPARIVEVGAKEVTDREAVAECTVTMTPDACARLVAGTSKGNPIEAARIAGVFGVKRTPDLLPFCHPIAVTGAEVTVEPEEATGRIKVRTSVRAMDRTGVEREALTSAAVAALSLYDTAKAFDRSARIDGLRLLVTSEQPWEVPGERIFLLSPLAVPGPAAPGADATTSLHPLKITGSSQRSATVATTFVGAGEPPAGSTDTPNMSALPRPCRSVVTVSSSRISGRSPPRSARASPRPVTSAKSSPATAPTRREFRGCRKSLCASMYTSP